MNNCDEMESPNKRSYNLRERPAKRLNYKTHLSPQVSRLKEIYNERDESPDANSSTTSFSSLVANSSDVSQSSLFSTDHDCNDESTQFKESTIERKDIQTILARKRSATGQSSHSDLYFVKWVGESYRKCTWIDDLELQAFNPHYYRVISVKDFPDCDEAKCPRHVDPDLWDKYIKYGVYEDWLKVDRVLYRKLEDDVESYLVKWKGLDYSDLTWECLQDDVPGLRYAITEYYAIQFTRDMQRKGIAFQDDIPVLKKCYQTSQRYKPVPAAPTTDPKLAYQVKPGYVTGILHDYQLDGINWLRCKWKDGISVILADEMGLGKTIQTVVFLYSLYKEGHSCGPFLIIAPLSTISHWEKEFREWAPDLYVVCYTGSRRSRTNIRRWDMNVFCHKFPSQPSLSNNRRFHVLLTTPQLVVIDSRYLINYEWSHIIVDEAHILKNIKSKFYTVLKNYVTRFKLLLTGTPIQNRMEELFSLLAFIAPDMFASQEDFVRNTADIRKDSCIELIQNILSQFVLRRLKADVLQLPDKSELIVTVELSPMQKMYYKLILTKNAEALSTSGMKVSLCNILMDLKKCCNHPYLFPAAVEEAVWQGRGLFDPSSLIKASGKLVLLQKMLRKLKNENHRVLIFSQMTRMLDILEDFLQNENYEYERLDGRVTGADRQEAIDRFNAPQANQFVFLISTRAGGLGINLASADTVIIYDSDWNPHNDIQALSRAHRIGQSNKVMIYRFVTRNSVEERIVHVARRKMVLSHLVVQPGMGMRSIKLTKTDFDWIIKFGAEELFQEGSSTQCIDYDDNTINELLDRSASALLGPPKCHLAEKFESWKVANYINQDDFSEELSLSETVPTTFSDVQFWKDLLKENRVQDRFGKGKRNKRKLRHHINHSF